MFKRVCYARIENNAKQTVGDYVLGRTDDMKDLIDQGLAGYDMVTHRIQHMQQARLICKLCRRTLMMTRYLKMSRSSNCLFKNDSCVSTA